MEIPKQLIDCLDQNNAQYEILHHAEAVTAQRIRASGTRERQTSGENRGAEIWRPIFDGRAARRSPHRSGEGRENDWKTCLPWRGKRFQITVPRHRHRGDVAAWESLRSGNLC